MKCKKSLVLILTFSFFLGSSCNTAPEKISSANTNTGDAAIPQTELREKKKILVFGNSLTAAFGLASHESFTSLIQLRLDSLGYEYEVINAGVSGETTATGSNRVKWVVERQPVDIFILELGANDGLRGVPVEETRRNLEKIIDMVREAHPEVKIILAGMMVPPSMGPDYSRSFNKVFHDVAMNKNATLIPFLLDHVAGIDSLNLPDGIHPNAAGQKIVADNVWEVLKDVL